MIPMTEFYYECCFCDEPISIEQADISAKITNKEYVLCSVCLELFNRKQEDEEVELNIKTRN